MRRLLPAELRILVETRWGAVLVGLVDALAVLTVSGLVVLWPGDSRADVPRYPSTEAATVLESAIVPCGGGTDQDCRFVRVRAGETTARLTLGPTTMTPAIGAGERVRVARLQGQEGADQQPLQFVDLDRRVPLLAWGVVLCVLAIVVLLWRGLLAVVGVGLSLLLVTTFLVPAILDGESALLVAIVGALAVTFVTTTLTNGVGAQTLAAVLGVAATLVLSGLLAWLAVKALRAIRLPFVDGINAQSVAQPALAAVVGCLALIAAVPLTTGLASLLVVRIPPGDVAGGHGHAH